MSCGPLQGRQWHAKHATSCLVTFRAKQAAAVRLRFCALVWVSSSEGQRTSAEPVRQAVVQAQKNRCDRSGIAYCKTRSRL